MKRYLTLLTLSFLSTTTLVEAVKLNILELPADLEERSQSLTAKAEKLQQNIDYTENEDLKEAFTSKYRIVRTLIDNPLLSEQDGEAYKAANEKRNMIATNFYRNAYQRDAYEKLTNITRYSELGIYPEDSQEGRDLKEIAESIREIRAWGQSEEYKVKGASGYLKREKRANQLLENIDEIKKEILAEAESIKAGPLLSELREIRKALPKHLDGDNDLEKIGNVLNCIRDICENEYEYDIIRSVIRYREVKEELPSLLENCRKLIKHTPSFVSSVLSGDYIGLEERISSIPYRSCFPYQYNDSDSGREEMNQLSIIMEHIRQLPVLLKKYNELLPIVLPALEKAERLEEAKRAQLDSFAAPSGSSYGSEDETVLSAPVITPAAMLELLGDDFPTVDPFMPRTTEPAPASSSSTSTSTPVVEPDLKVENALFSMGELSPYLSTDGFSTPEKAHIWTAGTEASITLPVARMYPRPSSVTFFGTCALVTPNYPQNLTVRVNGRKIAEHVYTVDNNEYDIEIPLPSDELATIEFSIPNAISPRDLTGSGDPRKLGIMFKEVLLNIEEIKDPIASDDSDDY